MFNLAIFAMGVDVGLMIAAIIAIILTRKNK